MSDDLDRDAFWGRSPRRNYVSRRFHDARDGKLRYFYKAIEGEENVCFATVGDEVVLRSVNLGRKQIKAKVLEDDRGIKILTIQRFNALNKPHESEHFSFRGNEITTLLNFIAGIKTVPLEGEGKSYVTDEELREIVLDRGQVQRLLAKHADLIQEIVQSPELTRDLMAVGYRRTQIERYESLMADPETSEPVWQKFFEENTWIFGYGLSYQFLSALDGRKLEQAVSGFDISGPGKRVDALMKTRGRINSLCFVEIKKQTTDLLARTPYRSGAWAPSAELAGAVAQVQNTVHEAFDHLRDKFEPSDGFGNPTGEALYNFEPRSCLIVGRLDQFLHQGEINPHKFRSFELFRRNTWRPEIITFDELLERARFIVEHGEIDAQDRSDEPDVPDDTQF
ncbi:MAG: Shedu immune nuclease family protein [Planctomycetota bacterium]